MRVWVSEDEIDWTVIPLEDREDPVQQGEKIWEATNLQEHGM